MSTFNLIGDFSGIAVISVTSSTTTTTTGGFSPSNLLTYL